MHLVTRDVRCRSAGFEFCSFVTSESCNCHAYVDVAIDDRHLAPVAIAESIHHRPARDAHAALVRVDKQLQLWRRTVLAIRWWLWCCSAGARACCRRAADIISSPRATVGPRWLSVVHASESKIVRRAVGCVLVPSSVAVPALSPRTNLGTRVISRCHRGQVHAVLATRAAWREAHRSIQIDTIRHGMQGTHL